MRKAGIIKPEIPVVIGEYTTETKNSFHKKLRNIILKFILLQI
jgi:folylpolyglutamate synthase/dihydropteroate synthase